MYEAAIKGIQASREVNGMLPCNVKVLCEGEEEVGSPNLDPFIRKEKERLACDIFFISDCSQFAIDMPAITYGLKGLCYVPNPPDIVAVEVGCQAEFRIVGHGKRLLLGIKAE